MLIRKHCLNLVSLIALLALSGLFFYEAFTSALRIWLISEIFNHCLLILPLVGYLIYRKRYEVLSKKPSPAYILLFPLIMLLAMSSFATIGSINIINHLALFIFIPTTIVFLLGFKPSFQIAFPLTFILFSVPIGEELIPTLQEITADMSVVMLQAAQIPVYRSGLYIDIPGGKFLVAEACSGISFLISSVAFGSLYAHLNFIRLRAKIGFTLVAIFVPIIANAIRVFGIIVIAHLTDMKYAVGADHLIYGWFFYLFVLACLFLLGEKLRGKNVPEIEFKPVHPMWQNYSIVLPGLLLSGLVLVALFWTNSNSQPSNTTKYIVKQSNDWAVSDQNVLGSQYDSPSTFYLREFKTINSAKTYHLSSAIYEASNPKDAITHTNKLFDQKKWSRANQIGFVEVGAKNKIRLPLVKLASVFGSARVVTHWYEINGKIYYSATYAKLYETYLRFVGDHEYTAHIVLSTLVDSKFNIEQFKQTVKRISAQKMEVTSQ